MKKHKQVIITIDRRAWMCFRYKLCAYTNDYLKAQLVQQFGHIRHAILNELGGVDEEVGSG